MGRLWKLFIPILILLRVVLWVGLNLLVLHLLQIILSGLHLHIMSHVGIYCMLSRKVAAITLINLLKIFIRISIFDIVIFIKLNRLIILIVLIGFILVWVVAILIFHVHL